MTTTSKLVATFIIIVIAAFAITVIQRNSAITNAEAAILSAQGTNEAYLRSLQTSDWSVYGIVLISIVLLLAVWAKDLRRLLFPALALMLVGTAACATPVRKAVTLPNEVTFSVQLVGDNTNQAVIGELPQRGDEVFWRQNLVNTQEITITTYCFQPTPGAPCQTRDAVRVIVVDTTPVRQQWIAPAILPGQPFPDMNEAFSMQSLEPNGGSTGVYVGAQIIAHIAPENAALYLASYGYSNTIDTARQVYPARPLSDVIDAEVRTFIQTELNREYGQRSVVEQNREMVEMFDTVRANLVANFSPKGITIDSFGFRDGNVYENPVIQEGIDSAFERQRQLEEAQANATRQAVINQQDLESAYARATQTMVAARSEAEAQQLQADVISANPNLVQYEMAQRWNGQLPQIVGDSNAVPMIPFSLNTPTPAPNPQPTPVPGQ